MPRSATDRAQAIARVNLEEPADVARLLPVPGYPAAKARTLS